MKKWLFMCAFLGPLGSVEAGQPGPFFYDEVPISPVTCQKPFIEHDDAETLLTGAQAERGQARVPSQILIQKGKETEKFGYSYASSNFVFVSGGQQETGRQGSVLKGPNDSNPVVSSEGTKEETFTLSSKRSKTVTLSPVKYIF